MVGEQLPHEPWASEAARPARPTNYARSAVHFTSAVTGLVSVALLSWGWLVTVASAFAIYTWSMEIGRRVWPRLNDRLMAFYGPVAHPQERYRVNSATWYATALLLIALFATRPAMMAALIVLGVADPIAAFVGRRWGTRVITAGRSLEGTLAFFVSGSLGAGAVLALAHAGTPLAVIVLALLSGFVGALAELFATKLDDNFTIPVAVAAVAMMATPLLA